MTQDMLNEIFLAYGISLLREIKNNVYLIDHADCPDEKQVLKVIDIPEKAMKESNEKISADVLKALFRIIHANELIWNEKITLTKCEYLVRVLENYTIGTVEEEPFLYAIRMPYYKTLSTLLEEGGLDENEIIHLGIDICNALRTLHHDGSEEYYRNETVRFGTILHLDIKPDNIFFDETNGQRTYMLGDFGTVIEKGKPSHPMRSYGYYAPEMNEPKNIPTEAADIFFLGMVLYRCICDSKEELEAFWEKRCTGNPVEIPNNCSPHLWTVIEKATRTDADERYQSAAMMQEALRKVNENKTIVAEVLKENAESKSELLSFVSIIEAGVLLSSFLGKLKKAPSKTEQLDFDIFGAYEGETKNGNPHGKGTYTYQYGNETKSIVGTWEWVNKKKMKCGGVKLIYTGMLCNGKICGLGESEILKTGTYLGITENGNLLKGSMQWKNGDVYAGFWTSKDGYDYMHGEGIYCYADGTVKKGKWVYGKLIEEETA